MKYLTLIFFFFSCTTPEATKPCNKRCGKLNYSQRFPLTNSIKYTFVNDCKDTISRVVYLNDVQLGNDNGASYYVRNYGKLEHFNNFCEPIN